MLPEPRASVPAVESGLAEAGVWCWARRWLSSSVGGGWERGRGCGWFGSVFGFGAVVCSGARAGQVGEEEVVAVWAAGEADGGDPGGAVMRIRRR